MWRGECTTNFSGPLEAGALSGPTTVRDPLAHRLQESARRGEILISEATYRQAGESVRVEFVDRRHLPGRSEAVRVYSVLGLAESARAGSYVEGVGPAP